MYLSVSGLGQPSPAPMPTQPPPAIPPAPMPNPGVPTPVPPLSITIALVRSRLQCTTAQLGSIRAALGGIAVSGADVTSAVGQAHNSIWIDLVSIDKPPRAELLKTPRSLITIQRFTEAFGKSPDALPWRGARRDLGWIVATRLGGASKTMFSSSVRISCWGWFWPGGGVDRPNDYMVKALPRQERVALGGLFWRAWNSGDRESMAAAILIAGLVIRYGISYQQLAPPLRNIHCYVKYALTMLGHPVPQWATDKCPQVV